MLALPFDLTAANPSGSGDSGALEELLGQVGGAAGVAPLVVVPGDELDKVLVQLDAGAGVKDRGGLVADEVGRDDGVLGVVEDTLELVLGSLLHGSLDGLVGSTLLDTGSKVDNGDVGGGHTHGHARELAVQVGDDLSDSLSGTGAAGNDVLSSGAATTPVLSGGAVNDLLGGGVGVDSGHKSLNDGELVVDDLGERSKALECKKSAHELEDLE